jgi:hypothetical protein
MPRNDGRLAQLVRAPRLHRGGRGFEPLTAHHTGGDAAGMEIILLVVIAILPLLVIGAVIYLAVRLAIRHEHRQHPDR